ncbi:MAG TPA: PilZ domain-containing protein, partial [Candidatus Acidoferrales bacterium]|nr:PilZ domain-containing protein [Candidatus Acidoferrales bacterium]
MSSNPSVLGELVNWFLGRSGDRRQYKRRAGAFHVWWQAGPSTENVRPGIGLDLSPNGLMFIIPDKIPATEFNLLLGVEDRKIPVRVRYVRGDAVQHNGAPWNRYMGEFTGIAADDWDRIVRYVNHEAEPKDRRKMQNQEMHKQPDDAYRLLPLAIQNKIVAILVSKRRLAPPNPGQPPLL